MAHCMKCGNVWEATKASPKRCPDCKSSSWMYPPGVGIQKGRISDGANDGAGAGRSASVEGKRTGNDASVSVVRKAKGSKERLHPVQPVRKKLAGRGGLEPRPETQSDAHAGHRLGDSGRFCITCGVPIGKVN